MTNSSKTLPDKSHKLWFNGLLIITLSIGAIFGVATTPSEDTQTSTTRQETVISK